jgi:hypothetical protein
MKHMLKILGYFSGNYGRVSDFYMKVMGYNFRFTNFHLTNSFHGTNYLCKLRDTCIWELKTMYITIIIFWEMTPCGSCKNRRFGGSYRLHLQGARVRTGYRAKL